MLIFGARHLLSLKNGQMCFQNSFSQFPWKIEFSRGFGNSLHSRHVDNYSTCRELLDATSANPFDYTLLCNID